MLPQTGNVMFVYTFLKLWSEIIKRYEIIQTDLDLV